MYSRYTTFSFDEADRQRVLDFWEQIAVPSASRQEGWRGALILESVESAGRLRTATLWESKEAFDCYYASDEHKTLGAAIREARLHVDDRDGLDVLFDARPGGGILRITQARVKPDRIDDVAAYWRSTGCSLINRQPGCLRAEAYWGAEPGHFNLVIEWRSLADAERFLTGDDHKAFGAALDECVTEVFGRTVLERIA